LPKEVPSWFEDRDTDRDGMIGLYEWRRAGLATKDFVAMDLNGDCYLTADEWILHEKMKLEKKELESMAAEASERNSSRSSSGSSSGSDSRETRGRGERPSRDSKDTKETKESKGRNPFMGGR
jgi:hypothetical protein